MPESRPTSITAVHLQKLALVYVRQSSPNQVLHNTGSTQVQRDLADMPRRWGWSAERIVVIDEDLGLSAAGSASRSGFDHMLDLMNRAAVGIVVVRDFFRLSRNVSDGERFVSIAKRHRVLIEANGRIYDATDNNMAELFMLYLQNILGWYENRLRIQTLRTAREAKARLGHVVSAAPTGYVESVRGTWVKDPDPAVREAIGRVFKLYSTTGSILKTAKFHWANNFLLPRRRIGGDVKWDEARVSVIWRMLKNPNYCGDYVYRRWEVLHDDATKQRHVRKRPPEDWVVVQNHHEAYIPRDQWEAIQQTLASKRPTVRPPIGKGPALLQGLIWCLRCRRWLSTKHEYRCGSERPASYKCGPDKFGRYPHRLHIRARVVDQVVTTAVRKRITPLDRDAVRLAIDEHRRSYDELDRTHQMTIRRATHAVEELRHRYAQVDPHNGLVKADVEAELEKALCRLETAQRAPMPHRLPSALTAELPDIDRIVDLAHDFDTVWKAETTTNEDRKQLLRCVLEKVIVEVKDEDELELRLCWLGGLQTVENVSHVRSPLRQRARQLTLAGLSPHEVVKSLRTDGTKTMRGSATTSHAVHAALKDMGRNWQSEYINALKIIRQLLVDGFSRSEIRQKLTAAGVTITRKNQRPQWTVERLHSAVQALKSGRYAAHVDPLPPDFKETPSRRGPRREARSA
jgi:DNA invertase Pin-like site-specific DNA recombinase